MKIGLIVLMLASTCVCCFGQESPEFKACSDGANAQSEMNRCASEEDYRTDQELNKTYQHVVALLHGNVVALSKLQEQEKAWIRYRDAYIEAMYPAKDKQTAYGSIFPMEVDLLRARLTRDQIKALMAILEGL